MDGTSITSKGQVTIPKDIREALGLKPGDRVTFVADGDKAILLPAGKGDVLALEGILRPYFRDQKPLTVEGMREAAKGYVVARLDRARKGRRK